MADLSEHLGGPPSGSSESKSSILLVDDSPANLLSLRAILDDLGQHLVEARSGEEALEWLKADDYAVVLLDVLMPGLSGFETAKAIRSQERSGHTPIIFLTASDIDRSQVEEAYRLGAVDFLSKPLLPVAVRAKVRGFVELFQDKQKARREAEQLRMLVNGTADYAIFMLDPEGRIVSWNSGAERLKGYKAEEIIGQHFSTFYPQEAIDRGWSTPELKVAAAAGRFEDEGWLLRKDGSRFWANVVITALKDERGNLLGFSKITRDLTERKQAEESARRLVEEATARRVAEENARLIQEQREWLHTTLASIGDGVITTDTEGRVTFLNPVAETLTGWSQEEGVSGKPLTTVFNIINEESRQPVENPVFKALREGQIVGLANHTVLIARDSTERPIADSAAPIRHRNGKVAGVVLVFRDVTEQRQAEEALRRSEAQFRQLADSLAQIVWTARPDGKIDYLNRRWAEFTGLPQTVSNDAWDQLLHPDDAKTAHQRWAASLESGLPFDMEIRLLDRRRQSYRWHLIQTIPVTDEAGRVTRWFGTSTDIHEPKRAEESARFLAQASAELAVVVNYESTLQKIVNLAVPHFADWSAVDLASDDGSLRRLAVAHQDADKIALVHQLVQEYPPDPQASVGAFAVLRTGRPELVAEIPDELLVKGAKDERHLRLIRSLGLVSYICVPLVVSSKALGVLTFATAESGRRYTETDLALAMDLAQRAAVAIENTQLYQALRDADRRKNEFLATLAHELRNPLAPIRSGLQILRLANERAAREQAREMMERQLGQMVRLVDDLLDISRITRNKLELRKARIPLASVIENAVETTRPLLDLKAHALTVTLPSQAVYLDADLTRLAQVFWNLLNNAAKYTDPGGRIELSAECQAEEAVVTVRDNGIGISGEALPSLFTIFSQVDHSLERSQGGLGIGLALVKGLVEMHGGSVAADSAGVGGGSKFVVRLPLAQAGPQETNASASEVGRDSSGRRILVVDDNRDAAASLSMMLSLLGHDTRTAHDGLEALDVAAAFRPEIVLLDIGMPKLNGYDVARRIRQEPWGANIVLVACTGWGYEEDRRRSDDAGFDQHMVKPVDPQALMKLLRELSVVKAI
jgi:PAS domain S-box-containing protein